MSESMPGPAFELTRVWRSWSGMIAVSVQPPLVRKTCAHAM